MKEDKNVKRTQFHDLVNLQSAISNLKLKNEPIFRKALPLFKGEYGKAGRGYCISISAGDTLLFLGPWVLMFFRSWFFQNEPNFTTSSIYNLQFPI